MKLYLSSSFRLRDHGDEEIMNLRVGLQAAGARHGINVILGEQDPAIAEASAVGNDLGVLEGCARLMGEADAFFGMLFERHGTGVRLQTEPAEVRAAVSFFEAELLNASLTRKPVCVALSRDVPPGPSMEEFLRLVSNTLGHQIVKVDRHGLLETFEDFCRLLARHEAAGAAWLFDTVSLGRVHRRVIREAAAPRLNFLGGLLREDGSCGLREDVLASSIARAEVGQDADGKPLSELAKLSYLWMGVRELARVSSADRINLFGDQLQRTLSLWNSSAAWYGLHGSHPMGCLAALNDLGHAREQTGRSDLPLGPRSSAYYSIGTKLHSRDAARVFFRQSLDLSRRRLAERPRDPSETLQMTASAQARLAQLGERWRFVPALVDFRRSLRWRERNRSSQASVGEAMNAYGFALFQVPGMRSSGLRLAAEGSQLLRDSPGGTSSGFYFRAERKRAEMLGRAGYLDEAIAVAEDARALAAKAQAFDQASPLVDLLKALQKKRRV